jgi:hypothetical protein
VTFIKVLTIYIVEFTPIFFVNIDVKVLNKILANQFRRIFKGIYQRILSKD